MHDRGVRLFKEILDGRVLIPDERLSNQGNFRQIFAQPALDHLGDDLRRLFLALGLLRQNLAFLFEHLGRHAVRIDIGRIRGRDVHGQVPRQGFIAALQRHQASDAAAMDIGAERARCRDAHEAADRDVFADFRDQCAAPLIEAGCAVRLGEQCGKIGRRLVERHTGDLAREALKFIAARHEVGLAIDFHEDRAQT